MKMDVPALAEGQHLNSAPGNHGRLINAVLNEFAPYFAPNGHLIYVRETGDKQHFIDETAFSTLGINTSVPDTMPDAVIHHPEKNRLFLVDAITGHGPIDSERRSELAAIFQNSSAGLVYVTAFLRRSDMAKYIGEISWETEVWVQEASTHLIHFDGKRFLGPYEN